MTISRVQLKETAALARLELNEDEVARLTRDCQSILHYFEMVREADPADAVGGASVGPAAPLREDRVEPDPLVEKLEDVAPDWREGYFLLPRLPALDADTIREDDG